MRTLQFGTPWRLINATSQLNLSGSTFTDRGICQASRGGISQHEERVGKVDPSWSDILLLSIYMRHSA